VQEKVYQTHIANIDELKHQLVQVWAQLDRRHIALALRQWQASKQARTIKVSKVTKRHCAGTVQSQGGRVRNVKQVGFESRPEDSYKRCM